MAINSGDIDSLSFFLIEAVLFFSGLMLSLLFFDLGEVFKPLYDLGIYYTVVFDDYPPIAYIYLL